MQHLNWRSWPFQATILIVNVLGVLWIHHDLTATPLPRLRVLAALPARDVDQTDRFTLVFDEALPTAASLGTPLSRSPFVIQPQPDGYWTWSAPDRLEFVLDKQLPPGRVFTIRPDGFF